MSTPRVSRCRHQQAGRRSCREGTTGAQEGYLSWKRLYPTSWKRWPRMDVVRPVTGSVSLCLTNVCGSANTVANIPAAPPSALYFATW
jgi:hypothetical protein